MKKIYASVFALATVLNVFAQTPTKKWQGGTSGDWDQVTANWVPTDGLPFPTTFADGDEVLLDDTRADGMDTLTIVGELQPGSISFANTAEFLYTLLPADANAILSGTGTIYKSGDGEVIVGSNVSMEGGIVIDDGYYTAYDPDGAINAFGPKVTFNGGGIKIHTKAQDNPTYNFSSDVYVPEGSTGEIVTSRRVNILGKVSGAGTLNIVANGERDGILLNEGADFSQFTGNLNIVKREDQSYNPGFYGLYFKTDSSNYVIEIDSLGNVTESGIDTMMSKTKLNLGAGTTMAVWTSGYPCFNIGELTAEDETATIWGYLKKSDSPHIFWRTGELNTDFTLAARFTGEQGSGSSYRAYNYINLVKVGTGTMRLTNGNQYINDNIYVVDGKLFVSNAEGTETGTGWYSSHDGLYVGNKGTLGGTGRISRNIQCWGTIAPGEDGIGTLTVADSASTVAAGTNQKEFSVEIKPGGAIELEVASATEFDKLIADTIILNEDAMVKVKLPSTYDIKVGDSFQLFNITRGLNAEAFAGIELPGTDNGWVWDTSNLASGIITLTTGGGSQVGLNTPSIESEISLYPNPNNGIFNLEIPAGKGISMDVYSLAGKNVYNRTLSAAIESIDLSHLAKGPYLVKLNTTEGSVVRKVVLK